MKNFIKIEERFESLEELWNELVITKRTIKEFVERIEYIEAKLRSQYCANFRFKKEENNFILLLNNEILITFKIEL